MTVVAIERRIDGALTSADTAYLSITSSSGLPYLTNQVIAPTSAGVYSHNVATLPAGTYTATWRFVVAGLDDDVLNRPFVVDAPIQVYEGFRLMDLEVKIARMCGQYRAVKASSASNTTSIQSSRLRSTQNLGSFETEFALRRGMLWDGTLIENFLEDDRVRGVTDYTAATGTVGVDRAYTLEPQDNERVELLYLEPDEELRASCVGEGRGDGGLGRCFFWDTLSISTTVGSPEIDLTAAAPWITKPALVKRVMYSAGSSRLLPTRVMWSEPFQRGKSVVLRAQGIYAGSVEVTVLRPYSSYVNGEISFTGPDDDFDLLYGDIDYAAVACVLEAWKICPERLEPVTHQGMRPTRQEVADEFTKKGLELVGQIPELLQHRYDYPLDIAQIGNLAEPNV